MIRDQSYAVEPINAVRTHPKNAKRGDLEAIEASIAASGFYGSILVQRTTGLIIVGNHRWRAMHSRGALEIPVTRVECTDVEAERMAAADNRTSDLGGYDSKALVEQLERIAAGSPAGLAGTGYSGEDFAALEAELKALAASNVAIVDGDTVATGGPQEDDEDLESLQVPSDPITKRGDLWLLGEHRVLCGDSFNAVDRKILFRGELADLVLMDPPYAIYGSSTGIGADIADDKMVRPFFEQLFRAARAGLREFGHLYVCCDWRSWSAIWDSARQAQITGKNCIVWDKGGGGLGSMYANCYELIGFFARLPAATAMRSTTRRGQRTVMQPNIARFNRVSGKEREHNAAKPVALFEWLIGNSSDPGELVADYFLGSGTTVVAAEKTKRRCYGFEIEPKIMDVVVARWERLTGGRARRVPAEEMASMRKSVAPPPIEEKDQATVDDAPPVAHLEVVGGSP